MQQTLRIALLLVLALVLGAPLTAQLSGMEGGEPSWAEMARVPVQFPEELQALGEDGWSDWVGDAQNLVFYRAQVRHGKLIVEAKHDTESWGHSYALDNGDRGGSSGDTSITAAGKDIPASAWTQYGVIQLAEGDWPDYGFAGQAFFTTPYEADGESVEVSFSGQVCDEGNCFGYQDLTVSAPVHASEDAGASEADAAPIAPSSDAWSEWKSVADGLVMFRVLLTSEKLYLEAWHDEAQEVRTFALDNAARGGSGAPITIEVSGVAIGEWKGPSPQDLSHFATRTINYGYSGRTLFTASVIGVEEAEVSIGISGAVQVPGKSLVATRPFAQEFELQAPAKLLKSGDWSYWVSEPDSELVKYRARVKGATLEIQAQHDEERHGHTYAFDNPGGSNPTSFSVSGATIGDWTWPEDVPLSMGDPNNKDRGYKGLVTFTAPILERSGPITIDVMGMACNENGCTVFDDSELYPALRIALGEVAEAAKAVAGSKADDEQSTAALRLHDGRVIMQPFGGSSVGGDESWLEFIIFCFLGGLVALLMPCVYPMIPITVSFFGKQAETSGKSTLNLALIYGIGLMATYTLLGFLLTAISDDGVSAFGGSVWVAAGIGVFFLIFAMSMLGMFELRLPYSLAQKLNMQGKAQGATGAVLLGLTFAITSMACTVPVVGSVLALAADGETTKPLIGMLIFSGTIAAPFVALGAAPGLLKRMPRAGGWMNSVKIVFGFVELAAAAEFFGWARLISREAVLAVWVACAILSALYLLGVFRSKHDVQVQGIGGVRLLSASIFLAAGLWVCTGLFGGKLGFVESFLINKTSDGWQENVDLSETLADAKETRSKVFIDLTGSNCSNCRLFEQGVLEQTWGKELLKDFVKLKLYMDNDEQGAEYTQFAKSLFNFLGQPQYVVVNADGRITAWTPDVMMVLGKEGDAERKAAFAEFLNSSNDEGYDFDPAKGFIVDDATMKLLQAAGE